MESFNVKRILYAFYSKAISSSVTFSNVMSLLAKVILTYYYLRICVPVSFIYIIMAVESLISGSFFNLQPIDYSITLILAISDSSD